MQRARDDGDVPGSGCIVVLQYDAMPAAELFGILRMPVAFAGDVGGGGQASIVQSVGATAMP